jgi:hypothetical protein
MGLFSFMGSPSMVHAIMVHFPVVIAILGVPLLLLLAILRDRNDLRWSAIAAYAILLISVWMGVQSGEGAQELVPATITAEASELIEEHEEMAEKAWLFTVAVIVCLVIGFKTATPIRAGSSILALLIGLGGAVWIGVVGHKGGQLVYGHSVGTPALSVHAESPKKALALQPVIPVQPADTTPIAPESTGSTEVAPASTAAVDPNLVPIRSIDMAAAQAISFTRDVKPLIEKHCLDCHDSDKPKGNYNMTLVSTLVLAGKKAGPGVVPGKPDESAIIKYTRGQLKPQMPKGEDPLTEDEVHTFRLWIAGGALDDTLGTPVAPVIAEQPKPLSVFERHKAAKGDEEAEQVSTTVPEATPAAAPETPAPPTTEPASAPESSPTVASPTPAPATESPQSAEPQAAPAPAPLDPAAKIDAALDIISLAVSPKSEVVSEPAPVQQPATTPVPEPAPAEPTPAAPTVEPAAPAATPETAPAPAPPSTQGTEQGKADEFVPAIRPIDLEAAKKVSYARDIKPIVVALCMDCHDVDKPKANYTMVSVATMSLAGKSEVVNIVPGKPDESGIVIYLRGIKKPQMPKGEDPVTEEQLHLFRQWIAAGAVDDSAQQADAPAPAQQAAVIDDETRRLFAFDGDPVQKLTERRAARLKLVSAPPSPPTTAGNAIDAFVTAKWQEAGLNFQAQLCDDTAFLRRAFLDIIGLAPTADEAKAFMSNASPAKRTELIDALLARNEDYAANWVPFWEDALCSNGNHQGGVGTRGNYRNWIYQSFRENKPYDLMVAQLVDEKFPGSPGRFVLRQDRTQILKSAADSAQVFLGTSLKCASCHNHFENKEWTQARFLGFAGLFNAADLEVVRCESKTGHIVPTNFLFDLPNVPTDIPAAEPERLTRAVQLLIDPANPRFAKTIVNRLWKRLLGLGLFEPADDFRVDRPASHPELLDWLAYDFLSNGCDIKHTMRLILNSQTYQLKYEPAFEDYYESSKPLEPRYFRSPKLRRLTAEQALDSIAQALNSEPIGDRRLYRNDESTPLTRTLGRPATRNEVSTGRPDDIAVVQALEMLNGDEMYERIYENRMSEAAIDSVLAGGDPQHAVDNAYWALLGRSPNEQELALGKIYLTDTLKEIANAPVAQPQTQEEVWIDDALPGGANTKGFDGAENPWPWLDALPAGAASGSKALGLTLQTDQTKRHVFTKANPPLRVGLNDIVFLYVYIEPANLPKGIQIEWSANGWQHRAVWGEHAFTDTNGQPSQTRFSAPLPETGKWVRIEIPSQQLGLGAIDREIEGLSITQNSGTVYYDKLGVTHVPQRPQAQAVGDMFWALATSPEFQYIR